MARSSAITASFGRPMSILRVFAENFGVYGVRKVWRAVQPIFEETDMIAAHRDGCSCS